MAEESLVIERGYSEASKQGSSSTAAALGPTALEVEEEPGVVGVGSGVFNGSFAIPEEIEEAIDEGKEDAVMRRIADRKQQKENNREHAKELLRKLKEKKQAKAPLGSKLSAVLGRYGYKHTVSPKDRVELFT